ITFDDMTSEHSFKNVTFLNVLRYIVMVLTIVLQFSFLASDIYTLIQIYVLGNWANYHSISYVPILAYKIIFTACIGISIMFLIITWWYGTYVYKTNRVVRSYLDDVAMNLHSLNSFEKFCIYRQISTKSFYDWFVISIYQSWHFSIYNWLFADTPRQMLNGATIAYTISNSFTSSNIVHIVKDIANRNSQEAILLSFMTFSFFVWVIFTVKYLAVLLSSACICSSIRKKDGVTFSKFIHKMVADAVLEMYDEQDKK
ncbi:hypothetical protein CANARDRAFT_184836, partial [[Candida] arabinofermentans NRRL YB-2248]